MSPALRQTNPDRRGRSSHAPPRTGGQDRAARPSRNSVTPAAV